MPLFLAALLLFVHSTALAFDVGHNDKYLVDQFQLYKDYNHQHDINSIQDVPAKNWQNIANNNINLGYTPATVWVKFHISNPQNNRSHRLLDISYPLLDYVSVYQRINDGAVKRIMQSGDRLPFTQRNFKHPNFVSAINLKKDQQHQFLVKIRSDAPIQTEIIVWTLDSFQSHYRQQYSILFFYLGLILSSAAFNFLVYLYLKESVYLAYALYATSLAFFMASQHAILFEYLYPSSPDANNWSQLILANASIAFTALFNLLFLKLKPSSKSGWSLIVFIIAPIMLLLCSTLLGFSASIQATVFGALIILPSIFIIGLFNVKKNIDGWLFISAWMCLFVGTITFLASKVGLLGYNELINHSILIGSALELLIFAAALARRIHREKITRIQAQIESSLQTAKLHEEIIYSATHHDTTGLPNRNFFERWLNNHLRTSSASTLILFNLSRLHEIDKTLGRDISNETLEGFGLRLNSDVQLLDNIEALDTNEIFYAATLSGSTHGILINKAMDEDLLLSLKRLHEKLNDSLLIDNMEIDPYIHCAYALYPEHGSHAQVLLRHAGIALDAAPKFEHHIACYTKEINPYNERRLKLMAELKRAIANDSLDIHYQPLVSTDTGKFMGAEALIRWPHHEYGMIMPDEFIHIAEKTGVIQALSLWVFRRAIKQLEGWIKINPHFLLSINISAMNLQNNKFMLALDAILESHRPLAHNIILEITESQMMTDTQHAMKNLWHLSKYGFHIAIDDFGTGYSNLAYLTKLPASELKIDREFIYNLENEPQNQVLVETAIQMAHNLGLKVVAEGVESEATQVILGELNCDFCQGYYFSRPLAIDSFNKAYEKNRC